MYEKQTWNTGDVITEEKLNHMEDGIAGASIPLYTPEIIGQHGGANYYTFFAIVNEAVASIVLIKQEDPNDLFKLPWVNRIDGENIDAIAGGPIPMPIPGSWVLNARSPMTMRMDPIENKSDYGYGSGFYLNEAISSANFYGNGGEIMIVFMDHIPNVEYFEGGGQDPIG